MRQKWHSFTYLQQKHEIKEHIAAPVEPVLAPVAKGSILLRLQRPCLSPGGLPFLLAALPHINDACGNLFPVNYFVHQPKNVNTTTHSIAVELSVNCQMFTDILSPAQESC